MKLEEYKKMFGLDTEEKFRAWCREKQIGIYSCQYCDEILNPLDNEYTCCHRRKKNKYENNRS